MQLYLQSPTIDTMIQKVQNNIKKHKKYIQWILVITLMLSGALLIYIGYFDKVLFAKVPSKNSNQLVLYFHKTTLGSTVCNNLYPTYRTINPTEKTVQNIVSIVTQGTTTQEKRQGYTSLYSHETQSIVKSISQNEDTVYIDLFDVREIFPKDTDCLREGILQPIQKTLQANLGINKVIFSIDGDSKAFYNWIDVGCNLINNDCYASELPKNQAEPQTTVITSVSEKVKFDLPTNWYAQIDGYDKIEEYYSNIITATRITNWNEFESKALPQDAVEMTIIEISGIETSIDNLLNCTQAVPCTTEKRGPFELKKNTIQTERGVFEKYAFTKDKITYVIEIQFPFTNTANEEYQVTQNIINDVIKNIQ